MQPNSLPRLNALIMLNFYKILYENIKEQREPLTMQSFISLWPEDTFKTFENFQDNPYVQILLSKFGSYYKSLSTIDFQQFVKGYENYIYSSYNHLRASSKIYHYAMANVYRYTEMNSVDPLKPLLVFVPSLVNRGHIFNISPDYSLINYLAIQCGIESYVIDWGSPGVEENLFNLKDYTHKRLIPLLKQIITANPQRQIILVGYCMGGILALNVLEHYPEITKIALLAVPGLPQPVPLKKNKNATVCTLDYAGYLVPAVNQQFYFHSLNPEGVFKKFHNHGNDNVSLTSDSIFTAVEDWLNDGPALSSTVAKEMLGVDPISGQSENYNKNSLINDVDFTSRSIFIVMPDDSDVIIRPEASQALVKRLSGATIIQSGLGHIGMIISSKARERVWKPFADWLEK